MALPLPNLDNRRWADLVEEGRSLIPRYAPGWTDHNIHDPGITLMELFAWLTELAIYRTNCIPQTHRRKFLSLLGFPPLPPHPAQAVLEFTLKPGVTDPLLLPFGLAFAPNSNSPSRFPFRTLTSLSVLPVQIQAVQSFDGQQLTDLTQRWQEKLPLLPWGDNPGSTDDPNPEHQPAFYLGLVGNGPQESLPQHEFTLWFQFEGPGTDWVERDRWLGRSLDEGVMAAELEAGGSLEEAKCLLAQSPYVQWQLSEGQWEREAAIGYVGELTAQFQPDRKLEEQLSE